MPRTIHPLALACALLLAACEPAQPAAPPAPASPVGSAPVPVAQVPLVPAPVAPMPPPPGTRLPYAQIEAIVRAAAPGEIVEVELEEVDPDDGYGPTTGLYEIKVLAASGRVLELEIDATTGQILKQETE